MYNIVVVEIWAGLNPHRKLTGQAAQFNWRVSKIVKRQVAPNQFFWHNFRYSPKSYEIIGEMTCPKNFLCAESGFENLCKAKDMGLEHYLECLEAEVSSCKFAVAFGYGHFCRCPLRVYLAKNLEQ